jgi:hypothetical protein
MKRLASKRLCSLARALIDPKLLNLVAPSWRVWRAVLKAAHAEPLSAAERAAFDQVAGGREPPKHKVRQLGVVVSRRGGKGRAGAALAVFASALTDHSAVLAPGEVGTVAFISPTRPQAMIGQRYALGYFESSPVLAGEIAEVTADEIRLRNGNVIATLAADYRSLRGRTLLLAVLDEASFLKDETSRTSDIETARGLLPSLLTTSGMLVVLSSPYRRAGLLFQMHRDCFGKDDDDVLVVAGPSVVFNPTLDAGVIAKATESDPEAARSEWLGEFRSDLARFLADQDIDAAVDHGRPAELPPQSDVRYFAFVDMSAGRHDASTIAITHRYGERIVADVIRGRRGVHDPRATAGEYASLALAYGCREVVGDNFAAEWVAGAFREAGIAYRRAELTRSQLYLEGLVHFTRGLVSIPDHPQLLRELRLLERRTARSGKDSVDHGAGGHDDHANALFGAMSVRPGTSLADINEALSGILRLPPTRFDPRVIRPRSPLALFAAQSGRKVTNGAWGFKVSYGDDAA